MELTVKNVIRVVGFNHGTMSKLSTADNGFFFFYDIRTEIINFRNKILAVTWNAMGRF